MKTIYFYFFTINFLVSNVYMYYTISIMIFKLVYYAFSDKLNK